MSGGILRHSLFRAENNTLFSFVALVLSTNAESYETKAVQRNGPK